VYEYPGLGGSIRVPLKSHNGREDFILDVSRGRIDLMKNNFQNRARQITILARLDIGGAPHRNPDGTEVPCPHLHLYKEGFGDKWAEPLPVPFKDINDPYDLLEKFMNFCNVVDKPNINKIIFS